MPRSTVWMALISLAAAALLTGALRRRLLHRGLLDLPNARSSHSAPTVRGGGMAIVIVTTAGLLVLLLQHSLDVTFAVAFGGGGLAIAAIGFVDDRHRLRARTRLTVHFAAALWAVLWLGGEPPLLIGSHIVDLRLVGDVLAVISIVWTTNFFNFMDGIDGLAASEAAFVAGAAVLLGVAGAPGVSSIAVIFAGASCGFLLLNWPPAKIFLGDVGSGYLGFCVAVMALAATRSNPGAVWVWLVLTGTFFVDANVTLLRRLRRGESAHQAHRSHAYQWLARRWNGHQPVTLLLLGINALWLFPLALLCTLWPALAIPFLAIALLPLGVAAVAAGAGRSEVAAVSDAADGR